MEMSITTLDDTGGIEFSCTVIREEPRDPQPLLTARAEGEGPVLPGCSWCCRFFVGGRWLEVEEAAPLVDRDPSDFEAVTHTICPDCNAIMMREEELL